MRLSGFTKFCHPYWLWAMVGMLLLAYILRLVGLTAESLWIDEGYSLALASHDVHDIVQGAAADQHPPLYYLLLHLWLSAGESVFYLRYLSVLIGMLGVAATALIGRAILGRKAGVAVALLLGCSPMHIWYSQEVRMYVLLALLATLSVYMLWRLIHNRGGWVLYGLSTLLALYTHYFAGFILLFENMLALGWALKQRRGHLLVQWIGVQTVLAIAFIPWLPVALYQTRFHQMSWIRPPTADGLCTTVVWMLLGDFAVQRGKFFSLMGLGLIILAVIWATWCAHKRGEAGVYGFLLLWFVIPFATVAVISQSYPIFQSKQFLILLPPLLLLVAGILMELPRVTRWVLAGILIFFVVGSLNNQYSSNTKHGWREAAAYIEGSYQVGDVLYLNPAAGMLTLRVYLHQPLPQDGYPSGYDIVEGGWGGEPVTASIAEQVMAALAAKYRRVWLVEFGPEFWDPEGHLAAWLEHHGLLIADQPFRGIRVRLYDLARGSGP
jgi:uncharacterized membrane protein